MKNFSFLYDETAGKWSLSPAYDLTQNPGTYGERATTVNGKGKGIVLADLLTVGTKAGLKRSWAREVAEGMRAKKLNSQDCWIVRSRAEINGDTHATMSPNCRDIVAWVSFYRCAVVKAYRLCRS